MAGSSDAFHLIVPARLGAWRYGRGQPADPGRPTHCSHRLRLHSGWGPGVRPDRRLRSPSGRHLRTRPPDKTPYELSLQPVIEGVTNPFTLILKTAFIAGIIATSPMWLYQIWAFIVPGMLGKERKWTLIFLSAAIPLFLFGVLLAYFLIPKGIAVLVGFTPVAARSPTCSTSATC
jgi:hypothetical protein